MSGIAPAIAPDEPRGDMPGKPASSESVESAFREGERWGREPGNVLTEGGSAVTGERSDWCAAYCERCFHTFRIDDPVDVRVDASGRIAQVTHRSVPWCDSSAVRHGVESDQTRAFFTGIDEADPPRVSYVRRILPEDALLELRDTVRNKNRRRQCFVCTQSFRPYELVVTCPCHPDRPECDLSVHRDPAHNLLCYDDYLVANGVVRKDGVLRLRQCPTDGRVLGV